MKLYGLTPVKNEADRYLASMLLNATELVDGLFVFDDQSDDDTVKIALDARCQVAVRLDSDPSFLEHEGKFRQVAWDLFELCVHPMEGDWILAIDADEVLVSTGTNCCLRCEVDQVIESAEKEGAKSVLLPVPEVFGIDTDGTPLVRVDALWGTVAGTRLFRYEPGGTYRDKSMGCGAEPTYVGSSKISKRSMGLHLLHYGYAHEPDQAAKYERYTTLLDHGHNDRHVQSIVAPKTLKRWDGPVPKMERGDSHE